MTEATQEGATVAERLETFLQPEATAEVQPEAQQAEPVTEETETVDQVDAEPIQEVEAEATDEIEEESNDVDDTIEDNEDSSSLELDDFANLLGVSADKLDLDEDGSPVFKTKIDGVEGQVKVEDLLKSYQLEGHLNNKNMEVVEQKKALDSEREQFNQTANSKLQNLDAALNLANQQLYNEFNQVNWQALEQQDPSNYVVMRQKFADRHGQINQALQVQQQHQQEAQQKQMAQLQERVANEKANLFNKVPEWNTEESWQKGNAEIRTGLTKHYGLEEEILNDVVDHRFVLMARDALKYKQLQESKPNQLNKVKKAPKFVKPGSPQTKPKQATKADKALKLVKDSKGKKGSVANYLMEQGIV